MNTNEQGEVVSNTNHCALIYGSLPPETKILQQEAFNERSGNVKYLLATDAIGMGMNLNVSRVIFASLRKHIRGSKASIISKSSILQIAGRAGRYMTDGYVSAFNARDLKLVRGCIENSGDLLASV
jgi:ATP-dependent RNA helicase SUPV3L1/SUV3